MLYKFQHWLGVGKSVELDRLIERDERMRSQYVDPIENFPDKIDELFDALNRVRFILIIYLVWSIFVFSFTWINQLLN
jgi:hypothetical protein